MKAWLRLIFTFACICSGVLAFAKAFAASDTNFYGEISKVVDGDTVHFHDYNATSAKSQDLKIRMIGIDAPESHFPTPDRGVVGQGPWGEAATRYLNRLIPVGTEVTLQSEGLDKYRRVLGRIFYRDHDVNLKMVQAGWAVPYIICDGPRCNSKFIENEHVMDYVNACESARAAGRGIYDSRHPLTELPYIFRLRMSHRVPEKYVGNVDTRKLYSPEDYEKVDFCHRIFFLNEDDALNIGFRY